MKDQELEVKLYLRDLAGLEARLQGFGARLTQPRTHERNLRFDTGGGDLAKAFQVLRLRQDLTAYLTFKGPSQMVDGVRVRQEIEFTVGDFETAHQFLLALGYQVSMIYEKYRTVYDLHGVLVSLDELPYGNFAEIEGPDPATIREINQMLGLNWERRVPASYTVLFEELRGRKGWDFRDLTFENFDKHSVTAADLEVQPAD